MNCREARRDIVLAMEGEAAAAQQVELDRHCRDCAECGREAEGYRRLAGLLTQPPEAQEYDVPDSAGELLEQRRRLMASLESRGSREDGWAGRATAWRGMAMAAVLVACGFLGGWALRTHVETAPAAPAGTMRYQVEGIEGGAQAVGVRFATVREEQVWAPVHDAEVQQLLLQALEHPANAGIRMEAIRLLGQTAQPRDPARLRQALLEALRQDPNPGVRLGALAALAPQVERGDTEANPTLLTALAAAATGDANAGVRAQAIRALGQSPAAEQLLRRIGNESPDPGVRLSCAAALQQLRAGVPSEWLTASAGGYE